MKICKIENCGKKHYALGLCSAHYTRYRRHGDPEGGRTPHGEPLRFFEDIILNHKDKEECLIWLYNRDANGRATMKLKGKEKRVCRVLCEKIYGMPPTKNHVAAHSCGKAHLGCCNPNHLRWATHQENHDDKKIHGTNPAGERNPQSKLTELDVKEIRILYGEIPTKDISIIYGVNTLHVGRIANKKAWAHLR